MISVNREVMVSFCVYYYIFVDIRYYEFPEERHKLGVYCT